MHFCVCVYIIQTNVYANTATCNTQTDRNNDVTAEDMMTRLAGRRERQPLVSGENKP